MSYFEIYITVAIVILTVTAFNTRVYNGIILTELLDGHNLGGRCVIVAAVLFVATMISPIWLCWAIFRYPKILPYYLFGYVGKLNITVNQDGHVTEVNNMSPKNIFATNKVYCKLSEMIDSGEINGILVDGEIYLP